MPSRASDFSTDQLSPRGAYPTRRIEIVNQVICLVGSLGTSPTWIIAAPESSVLQRGPLPGPPKNDPEFGASTSASRKGCPSSSATTVTFIAGPLVTDARSVNSAAALGSFEPRGAETTAVPGRSSARPDLPLASVRPT